MNRTKRYITTVFLFFLLCPALVRTASGQPVSVCSFNIRGSNMSDGINSWENRRDSVIAEFTKYQYDIICMQEPLIDQINDFMSIDQYEWLGLSNMGTTDSDVFTPILYDKSKLNVLEYGTFWLSPTPDIQSKGWDGKFPRICTWARFRDIKNCRIFYVFNTHLDHVGATAKVEGAKLICRMVNEKVKENAVFITGDMNSTPSTPAIKEFEKQFKNARNVADVKIGPSGTAHSYGSLTPPSQIDFIFINDKIQVSKFTTITKKFGVRYMSDHYPIVADINF